MKETINISNYLNLLRKNAWFISKKYHILFDDVLSESIIIFYEALLLYDEKKGKFSTFLMSKLRMLSASRDKRGICFREYLFKTRFISAEDLPTSVIGHFPFPARWIEFSELVEKELSVDTRFLLDFILIRGEHHISRKEVSNLFVSSLHWNKAQFIRAWKELKIFLPSNLF